MKIFCSLHDNCYLLTFIKLNPTLIHLSIPVTFIQPNQSFRHPTQPNPNSFIHPCNIYPTQPIFSAFIQLNPTLIHLSTPVTFTQPNQSFQHLSNQNNSFIIHPTQTIHSTFIPPIPFFHYKPSFHHLSYPAQPYFICSNQTILS